MEIGNEKTILLPGMHLQFSEKRLGTKAVEAIRGMQARNMAQGPVTQFGFIEKKLSHCARTVWPIVVTGVGTLT